MEPTWNPVTRARTLHAHEAAIRHRLLDAARDADWPTLFALLESGLQDFNNRVNATRPDGPSLYAPLHHAAWHGAPLDVIHRLIRLGAWRTLRDARGQRPIDVARELGHRDVFAALEPSLRRQIPTAILARIQVHLHAVIRERAEDYVHKHQLRLPELEPLLELDEPRLWCPIPGIHGGFALTLQADGDAPVLMADSWSRVVEGSGQRHEITAAGARLVDEGFV
jgi:hypothetical protein